MNTVPPLPIDDAGTADASITSPLNALRRWLIALCIIRFDLEQGQVMEECYPPNSFSPEEQLYISFSSFPDSMSQNSTISHRPSIYDSTFFFRFPSAAASPAAFLYGFVFNRRRQDARLPRGGEQKSVVILSSLPYSVVFRPLLQILGPLCFDIGGGAALERVASHVSTWLPPAPGRLMELPIGNAALKVHLPPPEASLFHDTDLFGALRSHLLQLWTLWELVIVGESLLVIAPSPQQCSEAVAGLVSLAAPLHYAVDFRPYFTIHDSDFARLNTLEEGIDFPAMLLGVTNLFFLKSLKCIPHVISVGTPSSNSTRFLPLASRSQSAPTGRNSRPTRLNLEQISLNKFSPSSLLNAMKLRRDGPLSLMTEHREAIWSSYAPTTKTDTSILNRLVDVGMSSRIEESMSVVNNEILRRHFLELTTNFLAPFGPFFRSTAPPEGISPFANPPPLPPFHAEVFISTLATRGPGKFLSKRMRSNWLDLYRRFLKGPNFKPWFQRRRSAAEKEQINLWRQACLSSDLQNLIPKMNELEVIDTLNAIERDLLVERQSGYISPDSAAAHKKLKGDLRKMFHALPKDMQQLMLCNPERAALLQDDTE